MKRIYDLLLPSILLQSILFLSCSKNIHDNTINNTKFPAKQTNSGQVTVYRISTGRIIHRFFDTSPISPSGRFTALFRIPYEDRTPKSGDYGEVVLVDLKTGEESVLARSRGWELQVGANVQWGKSDEELFFNDVDTLTWNAFAIKLNPFTDESQRMEGTLYEASMDGTKLISHNLLSSQFIMKGYGVVVPGEYTKRNIGPVDSDGIYVTSTLTGKCEKLVSIKEIYENTEPAIKFANPEDYEFYCFQVKWNPQGTRILVPLMWLPKGSGPQTDPQQSGQLVKTIITMRADGSEIKTAITPDKYFGHHMIWMPDGEHISMNLRADAKSGLKIKTFKYDGSDMKVVFSPGSGHPSFHPGGLPLIITDAYPGEEVATGNAVPIRFLNTETGVEQIIDSVFVSMFRDNLRIDAHPAWDRSGRFVIYNGAENATRTVFIADLKNLIKDQFPEFRFRSNY